MKKYTDFVYVHGNTPKYMVTYTKQDQGWTVNWWLKPTWNPLAGSYIEGPLCNARNWILQRARDECHGRT